MAARFRRFPIAVLTATLAACLPASQRATSVDVVSSLPPTAGGVALARLDAARPLLRPGAEVRVHERFGLPTFLWASPEGSVAGLSALRSRPPASATASTEPAVEATAAARAHLGVYASLYALDAADVDGAVAGHVHDLGRGPIVVQFHQSIGGVEVFRERASVVMDRQLRLVAIAGFLSGAGGRALASTSAVAGLDAAGLDAAGATAVAISELRGGPVDADALRQVGSTDGGYVLLDLAEAPLAQPARARPTWFHGPRGLVPAWYVEADTTRSGRPSLFAQVISAADGAVLFKGDLTADQAAGSVTSYRVWASGPADASGPASPFDGPQGNLFSPHPTGTPDGTQPPGPVARVDVSLASSPSCADPWLPPGASETTGNNVEAYADLEWPHGFTAGSADFHAGLTGPGAFLYSYDASQPRGAEQRSAALVQLFYDLNFLHDWFYASGFTEPAGNAQADNYGRGGLAGDSIQAEGQDFGGRNNATMTTPADGGRPRMQLYLFDGIAERHLYLTGAVSGDLATGVPSGWGLASHDVTGRLVRVDDGVGSDLYPPATSTTATVHDGCDYAPGAGGAIDPAWASVTGNVVLIDRGGAFAATTTACGFADKALNAQRAGAIGLLIASTTPDGAPIGVTMGGWPSAPITIPVYQVGTPDGDALRAALASGTVTARLLRAPAIDRDAALDGQIVAHEFGHYISNRLVADSSGLTNEMGRALGEGWADFHALLLTVKEEDAAAASGAAYRGAYALAVWATTGGTNGPRANQGVYFGLRRMPYSTDLTRNNQTFANIQDSSAVPVGVPYAFWPAPQTTADFGGNSEVHNAGEIWATMLWECYAGLLRDTLGDAPRLGFAQARRRMTDYLVASYQITPPQPTLLEARDALLAAVRAGGDFADYHRFLEAFARRGAGYGAIGPDRYSTTNNGVVESTLTGVDLALVGASIADDVSSCDRDGILDSGETGHLSVTLRNDSLLPLTATTATVTATGPGADGLTFPGGNVITFGATDPGQRTTGSIPIAMAPGLTGRQSVDLQIASGDPALPAPATSASWSCRGNLDDVPGQAPVDDVESSRPQFDSQLLGAPSGATGWYREELDADQHAYAVPVQNGVTDLALVSPVLLASRSNLTLTFSHRHDFGGSRTSFRHGGVVELSADGGGSWTDIGELATGQPYTAALAGGSPLGTRRAFAGRSPGYPGWVTSSIDLGTAHAGQTLRVRFRVGTDATGRAGGWEVDDIGFTGLANRPFPALLTDRCTAGQPNRPPVAFIAAVPPTPEWTPVALAGSASDADGDPIVFQWVQISGPLVVLSDPGSQAPTFTAPEVAAGGGTVTLGLLAFDGTAWSELASRAIAITDVDRPPTADAGAPQTVAERTLVTLAGRGADPDGDPLGFAWTQTSGPAVTLLGASSAAASFLAPEVAAAGARLEFHLTVTAAGASALATTSVQVTSVNRPPVASAGPALLVDERTVVTLAGAGTDPDGDALTYAWTQVAPPLPAVTLSDPSAASPTFTAPEVTADVLLTFQLVVSDGALSSPPSQVMVTVRHLDRHLVASAGAAQEAPERTTVQLSGSGSDPDGLPVSLLWVQTGGPAVALPDPTGAVTTFTAPEVGPTGATLTFRLTVSAAGSSASSQTTVAVRDVNRAPVAVIVAPSVALEGSTIALLGSASFDLDGPVTRYRWTVEGHLPPGAELRDARRMVAHFETGAVDADTDVTFHLVVGDGLTSSATASVTVTVLALGHAPVAVSGADLTAAPGETVTLSADASGDDDGRPLTFAWRQVSGPGVTLGGATTASPSFTAPRVATTTRLGFEVTVTDGHGRHTSTRQYVTVVPPAAPPMGGCATGEASSLSLLALAVLALRRRRPRFPPPSCRPRGSACRRPRRAAGPPRGGPGRPARGSRRQRPRSPPAGGAGGYRGSAPGPSRGRGPRPGPAARR